VELCDAWGDSCCGHRSALRNIKQRWSPQRQIRTQAGILLHLIGMSQVTMILIIALLTFFLSDVISVGNIGFLVINSPKYPAKIMKAKHRAQA